MANIEFKMRESRLRWSEGMIARDFPRGIGRPKKKWGRLLGITWHRCDSLRTCPLMGKCGGWSRIRLEDLV